MNQKLNEEILNKNTAKLYWSQISYYQILSEVFICNNIDNIDLECLKDNPNIKYMSYKFMYKHRPKFNHLFIYYNSCRKIQRWIIPILLLPNSNIIKNLQLKFELYKIKGK